ncbi:hypothetical protein ACP70R_031108 [Stipagrostis hirtigluma subsp. patula]
MEGVQSPTRDMAYAIDHHIRCSLSELYSFNLIKHEPWDGWSIIESFPPIHLAPSPLALVIFLLRSTHAMRGKRRAIGGWEVRGRRAKGPSLNELESESDDYSTQEEDQYGTGPEGAVDGSGAASRSSVRCVCSVISKFDARKSELVSEIGFGGLLELPQINRVDRSFTVWLLSNLDTDSRTIVVNGQPVIDIVDLDVSSVMGIPCGRHKVCSLPDDDARSRKKFLQQSIGATCSESNGLLAARRVITEDYQGEMSKEQCDQFKVAFVVFVVGHLLAPTTKNNYGSSSFWGALLRPEQISQYNWSEFVLDALIQAARVVQSCLRSGRKVTTISGCAIFLQVLYLDSLRLGPLDRPKDIVPRIKAFTCRDLRLMIKADECAGGDSWGASLRATKKAPAVIGKEVSEAPYMMDLCRFLKENFNGQMTASQKIAMQVFNARCDTHFINLKNNLMKENLTLFEHLLSGSNVITRRRNVPAFSDRRSVMACDTTYCHEETSYVKPARKYPNTSTRGYESAMEVFEARRRARDMAAQNSPSSLLGPGHRVEVCHPMKNQTAQFSNGTSTSSSTGVLVPSPAAATTMQAAPIVTDTTSVTGTSLPSPTAATTMQARHIVTGATRVAGIEPPSFDLGIDYQSQSKYIAACKAIGPTGPQQNTMEAPQHDAVG